MTENKTKLDPKKIFADLTTFVASLKTDTGRLEVFMRDAKMIGDAITAQMQADDHVFKDYLSELQSTASCVDEISLLLPVHFEVFLPIRLPTALAPSFDQQQRTVQLRQPDIEHPFFFGNMLNASCMNLLLKQELQQTIASIGRIKSYDLSYRAHHCRGVPFMHQILAVDRRSNGRRCIRFDFVLAVLFEGPVLPLPPYYDAPINYTWLAYGKIEVGPTRHPADWGVIVPKWQTRSLLDAKRLNGVLLLTHRLLSTQQCQNYAAAGPLKLGLATAVQEIKSLRYKLTPTPVLVMLDMDDETTNGKQLMSIVRLIDLLYNGHVASHGEAGKADNMQHPCSAPEAIY
ncbi:uncharacterized protein LOC117893610 [Drosophila subobscura]|uniref:uncharacterized protein LOC117893610 n=1 Tax=Drosophila subobscura TaxID=7241 RepID=UPI00155A50D3|nr:uncharacterized protein LOC117893610 [Drosophila subobscura]